jgi:hypothetical protein
MSPRLSRAAWRLLQVCSVLLPAGVVAAQTIRPVVAQEPAASTEYQLKAVFLFNFAQFVGWPDSAFAAPDAPLVIGILGPDPFGAYLEETVRGELVNGHPLMIRRFRTAGEVTTCHVLFVGSADRQRLESILAELGTRPILTVGEWDGFARGGGMIGFITDRNRIRLRINRQAAEAASLTLSSRLLRPAEIVPTGAR